MSSSLEFVEAIAEGGINFLKDSKSTKIFAFLKNINLEYLK